MAVLSPTAHVAAPSSTLGARVHPAWHEHVAVAALLIWWAWPLTRATGGREPHALSVGLGLLAVALVATRAWRRVSVPVLWLAASLPVAAFLVCLLAPTGWAGANEAASYAFAAGTFVAAHAYAGTAERRRALLALVALAGVVEFAEAWLPWWGGGDPSKQMWGTFYWHDQFGAFLLPAALIGLALVCWPSTRDRVIGWVAVPLCSAGVLFSTSRTVLALLLAGWAVVAVVAALRTDRRHTLPRLAGATLLAAATAFALTGPPFFVHRAAPTSAVQAREASQSATGNGLYRTVVWKEAAILTSEHPLAGTGFHGFGAAAIQAAPGWHHSAFAHNAWLQALSDGGLLLGVPFTFASLLLMLLVARRPLEAARRRLAEPAVAVGVVALGTLAVHSFVDFDLSYPALFGLVAVLAAVATAEPADDDEPGRAGETVARRRGPAVAAVAVLAGLAVAGAQPAWHGGLDLNLGLAQATQNGTTR